MWGGQVAGRFHDAVNLSELASIAKIELISEPVSMKNVALQ
jgi:hypothetical protein